MLAVCRLFAHNQRMPRGVVAPPRHPNHNARSRCVMAEVTVFYEGPVVTRRDAMALGLKRYFTGRACIHGHVAERTVAQRSCLICRRSHWRGWYRRNPRPTPSKNTATIISVEYEGPIVSRAEANMIGDKFFFTGIPCTLGHIAQRYTSGADCVVCTRRRAADRYSKDPDKIRATGRIWRITNPEKTRVNKRVSQARRRARKIEAGGNITSDQITQLLALQNYKCPICGRKLGKRFELDHIFPLSKRGRHDIQNAQLTHTACNRRKAAKDPFEFAHELGRLL
jgi:hypothetical protein